MNNISRKYAEKVINNIQSAVLAGKKFTTEQLEKQFDDAIAESSAEDTKRLDFLQKGHCILCLARGNGEYEFEIDGYQGAPMDKDVRKAIDLELVRHP